MTRPDSPLTDQERAALRTLAGVLERIYGGDIAVRTYWAAFLYHSPAQVICPLCRTVSPFHHDIYHSVIWVNGHYGECPGPAQEWRRREGGMAQDGGAAQEQ